MDLIWVFSTMSIERKSPICHGCLKILVENSEKEPLEENEVKNLSHCMSCNVAKYCSMKCQTKDYYIKHHKAYCKNIKKHVIRINEMEAEGMKLRPWYEFGEFGMNFEYVKYFRQRFNLAFAIWHVAETYDCYSCYENFFNRIVEIARFIDLDSYHIIRPYMIMALMAMGLDDEAYGIIKFWAGQDYHCDYAPNFREAFYVMAYDSDKELLDPGEYMHLPNQNKKENFYDDENLSPCYRCHGENFHNFVPALIAIKLNILLDMDERNSNFQNFMKALEMDVDGRLMKWKLSYPHIIDKIILMILGCPAKIFLRKLETQYEHLGQLINSSKEEPFDGEAFGSDEIILKEYHLINMEIYEEYQTYKQMKYFHRLFQKKPRAFQMVKHYQDWQSLDYTLRVLEPHGLAIMFEN